MRSVRFVLLVTVIIIALSSIAVADDYDPKRTAHPLRLIAYIVHPVGIAFDYLIFRPAHWVAHHKPLDVVFGHATYEDCSDKQSCAEEETERE